eukprot:9471807-Pyramimonas_sp.AAC.1
MRHVVDMMTAESTYFAALAAVHYLHTRVYVFVALRELIHYSARSHFAQVAFTNCESLYFVSGGARVVRGRNCTAMAQRSIIEYSYATAAPI